MFILDYFKIEKIRQLDGELYNDYATVEEIEQKLKEGFIEQLDIFLVFYMDGIHRVFTKRELEKMVQG